MKALTIALLISIVPPSLEPCQVWQALKRYDFIEEHNLKRVKVSCYTAPEGAHTADGSVPIEGMVSSNREHMGMDMILYTDELMLEARFQCTDIGGHHMLVNGTAVDFYRADLNRCYEFVGTHSAYVWIEWIPREETEDGQGD